jgi:hypothetical protein
MSLNSEGAVVGYDMDVYIGSGETRWNRVELGPAQGENVTTLDSLPER